jgi:hypothetical protein
MPLTLGRTDTAIASHLDERELERYLRGQLQEQHAGSLETHLLVCQSCQERLAQHFGPLILHPTRRAKADRKDQRSEQRFIAGDNAIFQEMNPLSADRLQVRIMDVSKHGLGIVSPKSVFPGTIVKLQIGSTIELGEVRFCSALKTDEYRIGLRLCYEL